MKLLHLIYVLVVLFSIPNISYAQVSNRDSLALVALYDSTDGVNWADNTNWLTGPVSTWHGITVENNNVTRIEFSQNNLSGHLPPQIGNLDSLQYLRLYWNINLVGEIPEEIGNLRKLETLDLNNNRFTGQIPASIGNLVSLQRINIDQSNLTGAIPVEITNCLNLESFRAANNELDSIPDLSGLPLLNDLWVSSNNFSGPLPEWFYSLTNMVSLNVIGNQFDGPLSADIANLQNLRLFYFSSNNFSGTIPKEIGTLNAVTFLQLDGNDFMGEIPPELGDMEDLVHLRLHNNQLTGEIPEHLANLDGLQTLNLGNNQLTGTIPDSIGYLTSLKWLYLTNNNLEGGIPQTFENLVNLEDIYLDQNIFVGTLDGVFENAHNAERIYIDGNNFEGAVPDSFVSFTSLTHLYIGSLNEGNNFSELPSFANNTTLNFLDIRNNAFTFEDIEPQLANTTLSSFFYSPQDSVGDATDTTVAIGSSLTLEVMVGGTANEYQWMKDDVDIPGANNSSYTIPSVSESDSGSYNCRITNTLVTDLTLYSQPVTVNKDGIIPVELTSFTASTLNGKVILKWTTASEINNSGFEVQRKLDNLVWEKIGFIEGNGTTTETQIYEFNDDIKNIVTNSLSYRLKQIDYDGSYKYSSVVNVEDKIPSHYALHQNFPNPFNPTSVIVYDIPKDGIVSLQVYNLIGEVVAVLVDEEKTAGNYEVEFNAAHLASGFYIYSLQAGSFVETRKMILMK
jgi:Leucine-rich repeat (LRR) protein